MAQRRLMTAPLFGRDDQRPIHPLGMLAPEVGNASPSPFFGHRTLVEVLLFAWTEDLVDVVVRVGVRHRARAYHYP